MNKKEAISLALKKRGNREKLLALKLTERDVEILRFINDFGFCEMPHLDKRFGLNKPRNYQLLNRLVRGGLLFHERIFYGRHGIYRLTRRGAAFTNLPAMHKVVFGTYVHDVALLDVYLQLRETYPQAHWIGQRALLKEKGQESVGKRGHLSDGILILSNEKRVAIEIELTLKARRRLEMILKAYGGAFEYKEVWYYCSDSVASYMRSMTVDKPFIKVYALSEMLGYETF